MSSTEIITLAAGSFWGVQAAFRGIALSTRAGYTGGHVDNPTPAQVACGSTGHAEAVEITYDSDERSSFAYLLFRFWQIHDCTLQPRHGRSRFHPYRSAIFFHTAEQEEMARCWIRSPEEWAARMFPALAEPSTSRRKELGRRRWAATTAILPATTFWPAPQDEQDKLLLCNPFRLPNNLDLETLTAGEAKPIEDLDPIFQPLDPGILHAVAAQSATHLKAIVSGLNRSFYAATQLAPEPPSLISLGFVSATVNEVATQSQVMCSWPDTVSVFTTNFRPGNFLARHESPGERRGYEAWIGHSTEDTKTPSALGLAGMAHDTLERAPREMRLPAEPYSAPRHGTDPARAGAWHEHLPDIDLIAQIEPRAMGRQMSEHLIRWHADELLLDAHHSEHEYEQALAALGAHRCECLDWCDLLQPVWIRQDWHDHSVLSKFRRFLACSSPWSSTSCLLQSSLLKLATKRGPLNVTVDSRDPNWRPSVDDRRHAAATMTAIESLPQDLVRRWLLRSLVFLEEVHSAGRLSELDHINFSGLALTPLCAATAQSLWQWCRYDSNVAYGHATHRLLSREETPTAEGFIDGDTAYMLVGVPFNWLTRVWCRGLAMIDGHLVLQVHGPSNSLELDVVAASWLEDDGPGSGRLLTRSRTISWIDGRWHLR